MKILKKGDAKSYRVYERRNGTMVNSSSGIPSNLASKINYFMYGNEECPNVTRVTRSVPENRYDYLRNRPRYDSNYHYSYVSAHRLVI